MIGFFKKAPKTEKRNYDGARISRLINDFIYGNKSVNAEINQALNVLRGRSQDLERNNAHVRKFLQLLRTNVVGAHGITTQMKMKTASGELDKSVNEEVEAAWTNWQKTKHCTLDKSMSWREAQRFAITSLARDGEILVSFIKNANTPSGFCLDFIPAEYLDESYNLEKSSNNNPIIMGVEFNQSNTPVQYYLSQSKINGSTISNAASTGRIKLSANQLLHVFVKERAFQARGVPWIASVIKLLKQLDGMREAILINQRVIASKMGFFVSNSDLDLGTPVDDGSKMMDVEPGTFHQLPAGVSLQTFAPDSNVKVFEEFESAILRSIATGLNVSYASLSSDLSDTSYSSIRQGALEDRDYYKCLQDMFISKFIEPIFQNWLESALEKRIIPKKYTVDQYMDAAVFRGRGFSWVDPEKEMKAQIMGLNSGFATLQDGADYTGRDISDIFDQIGREMKLAEEKGIALAYQPFGGGQSGFGPSKFFPEIGQLDPDESGKDQGDKDEN